MKPMGRKRGGQRKAAHAKWWPSKTPPTEKPLACRNGCGKRSSYPGYLRNHEKTCAERMAPGYGDATGIWSPPARCRMGCGGHFVYLAIHELECVARWTRPAPRPNDASTVPETLESPIADASDRLCRLACRKGCGATYAYVKCLRSHETACLGLAGFSRTKHKHSARTKRDAAKDSRRDEDKDVPETHEARAAANDAFTRAVFARLADAGDVGERRRFKWLSPAGELASVGEGSGAAEGPPASEEEEGQRRRPEEEEEEARKDAEVDRMLRERFPYVEP